jgi:hypothetical protein
MKESVSLLQLTCEICDRPWLWDWPYRSKKPSRPKFCLRCREKLEKAFKEFLDSSSL